jgi:hypothetical protein
MTYQRHTIKQKQAAVRLHLDGWTTRRIAHHLGKGLPIITFWLREAGVLRSHREAKRLQLISKITRS